jgi:hypothetical protein
MAESQATAIVVHSDDIPADKQSVKDLIWSVVSEIEKDASLTRDSTGGKAAKLLGSVVVGGSVATKFESLTPLKWALRGFGPLPYEFTKSGAIQVFDLSLARRAVRVAGPAAAKGALVFIAFNGGVYIGATINQALSDDSKNAIGGTINEIVNEEGWKALWRNPFGWRVWTQ